MRVRMQRHRGVEIRLGRRHLDRNRRDLDHLRRFVRHDVNADDAIRTGVDNELHDRALGPARERRVALRDIGFEGLTASLKRSRNNV